MSFDQDPNEQANISAADLAIMIDEMKALKADRDHWKANHDHQVAKARVLIDRTDMPLERVKAYKFLKGVDLFVKSLQDEVKALRADRASVIEDCARVLSGEIAFNFIHDHTGYSNAAEELMLWASQLRATEAAQPPSLDAQVTQRNTAG